MTKAVRGPREMVVAGGTGLLVPPAEAAPLAEALRGRRDDVVLTTMTAISSAPKPSPPWSAPRIVAGTTPSATTTRPSTGPPRPGPTAFR